MQPGDYILISGATSGIGYSFATKFSQEGFNIIGIARSNEALRECKLKLEGTYNNKIVIIAKDISVRENIDSVFEELKKNDLYPKILINNAGFAKFGLFEATDIDIQLEVVKLNIIGLTYMTKKMLEYNPRIEKILNISSMAGLLPGPYVSVYAATKAYVYSFSQALASELSSRNVQISVLCPSDIDTGFQERAGIGKDKLKLQSSNTFVEKIYKRFMKGERVIIPSFALKSLLLLFKFMSSSYISDLMMKTRSKI